MALVSFAKEAPEVVREEAVDEHNCHAGAWTERTEYRLPLKTYDPARGYALIARYRGGSTTSGSFTFRKLHSPQ
jgi:hypothetical protein